LRRDLFECAGEREADNQGARTEQRVAARNLNIHGGRGMRRRSFSRFPAFVGQQVDECGLEIWHREVAVLRENFNHSRENYKTVTSLAREFAAS
jgi:hypothetical protein